MKRWSTAIIGVAPSGRVLWRPEGAFAPEKATFLRRIVEQEVEAVTW